MKLFIVGRETGWEKNVSFVELKKKRPATCPIQLMYVLTWSPVCKLILVSKTLTSIARRIKSFISQGNKFPIKAGDGKAQQDLKFKTIYTSIFYIPFIREKTTRKRRRVGRFFRFSKHEFSLLGPSQCQMLTLEFCVSNNFNIQRSLQHYERKINDQKRITEQSSVPWANLHALQVHVVLDKR